MRLYITQKDFNKGVVMDCRKCPVGRSANRLAKRLGYSQVSVGVGSIHFKVMALHGPHVVACVRCLPRRAQKFIIDFDGKCLDGQAFKPFSFPIQDIPDLTAGNPG